MKNMNVPGEKNMPVPLRVVINGTHSKSGGGVTYLRNILPHLAAMPELELHLLLHKDQFELFYPISENVNVILTSFQPGFFRTLTWEQLAIPLHAWAMGADVVYSPANYGPILARNHVISLSNAVSVIQFTRKLKPIFYWLALTFATFISLLTAKKAIAVSGYMKSLLTFGGLRKKTSVIAHSVCSVAPERMHDAKPGIDMLAVSDIYIQKNYHTLLRAHAILTKKFPELKLVIAGREIDLAYARRVRKLSNELRMENNIEFLGHVETDELMELYRSCRVFVFPSLVESFGMPLLEAMAVGVPIACSNSAAMPEVLGDAGVYFDPKNEKEMAGKIGELLTNETLCAELGKKATQRAHQFSWADAARQTCAVLRDAAEPRAQTPRQVR